MVVTLACAARCACKQGACDAGSPHTSLHAQGACWLQQVPEAAASRALDFRQRHHVNRHDPGTRAGGGVMPELRVAELKVEGAADARVGRRLQHQLWGEPGRQERG